MRRALLLVLVLAMVPIGTAQARTKPNAGVPATFAAHTDGRALASLVARPHTLLALTADGRGADLVRARGGTLVSPEGRLWRVAAPRAIDLVPALRRLGALRYAEPDWQLRRTAYFTDPIAVEYGWHLLAIGADKVQPPPAGFPLTVIDSGIDLMQGDFAGRPGVVTLNPQNVPDLDDYHGTVVASTAAAAANGVGTVGVYPEAALRSFDRTDDSEANVIAGIDAAVRAGPSVINLSLGSPEPSVALYESILRATRSGSLVVAAAGNSYAEGDPLTYPASYPHVLTVGAIDPEGSPSSFSSSTPFLDLAAPGESIPFLGPAGDPQVYGASGTSVAAPIVAAAAAWVRTARGSLDMTQVAHLLRQATRDLAEEGFDERTGFGLLDLPALLAMPVPVADPLEPNDDVLFVVANGLFRNASRPINGAAGGSASVQADLDVAEDPDDVYRVVVPARHRLRVTVKGEADVVVSLWRPQATTVLRGSSSRLARSSRPGTVAEVIDYRNRTGRPVTLFLHVTVSSQAAIGNPRYNVALRVSR